MKTEHLRAIAEYLISHTGGEVRLPPRRTGKGVSFNDGMQVNIEYLQEMAKAWLEKQGE